MTREQLEERIKELHKALENSAQNHGGLLGRLAEAQHFLTLLDEVKESE